MDEEIERLVIGVRADTAGFARDVAAMRGELDGPLAAGADRAGRAIEGALLRAVRTGKFGFEDLQARCAVGDERDRGVGGARGDSGRWAADRAAATGGLGVAADRAVRRIAGARDRRAGVAGAALLGRRARARTVRADRERAGRGGRRRGARGARGDHGQCGGGRGAAGAAAIEPPSGARGAGGAGGVVSNRRPPGAEGRRPRAGGCGRAAEVRP